MVSINNDASGHSCFTEDWYEGAAGCSQGVKKTGYFWRLFGTNEQMAEDALELIRTTAGGQTRCNASFQGLGSGMWFWRTGGRSFDDTFNDPDVWVSYHWDKTTGIRGLTSGRRPKDITIAQNAFDEGLRAVAATIVHELAHVNGAPGKPSRMAEDTLRGCGFSDQFDEAAVGINIDYPPPPALYRIA
jgi:hypothetical protein